MRFCGIGTEPNSEVVLNNYRLTSLKTIISCAAPLSAGVQQMLHKKYNTGGRTVDITQGMRYAVSYMQHWYSMLMI